MILRYGIIKRYAADVSGDPARYFKVAKRIESDGRMIFLIWDSNSYLDIDTNLGGESHVTVLHELNGQWVKSYYRRDDFREHGFGAQRANLTLAEYDRAELLLANPEQFANTVTQELSQEITLEDALENGGAREITNIIETNLSVYNRIVEKRFLARIVAL